MPDLMIERIVPWQLNGQKQSAFLCTPEHLDELAAGYLYTQGMIAGLGDIAEIAGDENGLNVTLREGVAPEDCEGAFICASAWLAAAALTDARLGGAEELSSLRAGDVTIEVRGGANSERAAALRRSARQLMAPYTEGGGFFFCAVKG